jgi:hypothetical protein
MLVQSQEGFLRLFPAWPANASAAFSTLRMRGAVLVSAAYVGRPEWAGRVAGRTGGTANATLLAGAAGELALLSPVVNPPAILPRPSPSASAGVLTKPTALRAVDFSLGIAVARGNFGADADAPNDTPGALVTSLMSTTW